MVSITEYLAANNSIMQPVIIIILTFIFANIVRKLIEVYFEKSSKLIKADPTTHVFFKRIITGLVYIVGLGFAIYDIPFFRTIAISMLASAGILAVVAGFAAQEAFSNVVSGIFIVIFKPFRVGDRVKIKTDLSGVIEDITLRHTVIRNFENKRIIIPNSVISSEIIENSNFGEEKICRFVELGISYDSDINKAMEIMRDEAMKHPLFLDNRTKEEKKQGEPAVAVRVLGFGESSVNLRAWVWASSPQDAFIMGTDLNKSIKERFDKEGIEIPFPYRTLVYKKDIKNDRKNRKRGKQQS